MEVPLGPLGPLAHIVLLALPEPLEPVEIGKLGLEVFGLGGFEALEGLGVDFYWAEEVLHYLLQHIAEALLAESYHYLAKVVRIADIVEVALVEVVLTVDIVHVGVALAALTALAVENSGVPLNLFS